MKYTGGVLTGLLVGPADCGCWDKEGANELIYVHSSQQDGNNYLAHINFSSGTGCGDAAGMAEVRTLSIGDIDDCFFSGFSADELQSCTLSITPISTAPIPTLGQWGLICLMFSALIVGTVVARKHKMNTT